MQWRDWRFFAALCIAVMGLFFVGRVILDFSGGGDRVRPARVTAEALTDPDRTYEIEPRAEELADALDQIDSAMASVMADTGLSSADQQSLRGSLRTELALHWTGSLEAFLAHLKSQRLAPLPARLTDFPDHLRARWSKRARTLALAPVSARDVEIRLRRVGGQMRSFEESSILEMERPGRIPALPDPDASDEDLVEIVVPTRIQGKFNDGDFREVSVRLGWWFVRYSRGWILYKFTFYDVPAGVVVLPPFL